MGTLVVYWNCKAFIILNKGDGDVAENVPQELSAEEIADSYANANIDESINEAGQAVHYYITAQRYVLAEDYEKALEFYLKAHELDKTNEAIYISTAETYLELGDSENAEAFYLMLIDIIDNSIDSYEGVELASRYSTLGEIYQEVGLNEDAKTAYSKALELIEGADETEEVRILKEELNDKLNN